MTREEMKELAENIQALIDADDRAGVLEMHSVCMNTIEIIWRKVAKKMDGEGNFSGRCLSMHYRAKAFHCDADVLANEIAAVPMPRSGER